LWGACLRNTNPRENSLEARKGMQVPNYSARELVHSSIAWTSMDLLPHRTVAEVRPLDGLGGSWSNPSQSGLILSGCIPSIPVSQYPNLFGPRLRHLQLCGVLWLGFGKTPVAVNVPTSVKLWHSLVNSMTEALSLQRCIKHR